MADVSRAISTDLKNARRVLIHGVTGSGKSAAAFRIGEALGLPVHLADEEIGWVPAAEAPWTNREPEEMRRTAARIAAEPGWVLDSSYGAFRDIVLERTDVVIGLDYPRRLSLFRLTRRTVRRLWNRTPICNGNWETLRQVFSRDSIIAWHFRSFAGKRATMRAWARDPAGPATIVVSGPAELDALIQAIS
jgi:adenylate kinase family enzyme